MDPAPFPAVVERLKQQMTLVCFHREERSADPAYSRAVFCVEIGATLFDAFFNSSTGYRGAYFASPEEGLAANRFLIDELSQSLVDSASEWVRGVEVTWVRGSLGQPSAKAWLAEEVLALCDRCRGGWSTSYGPELEISNGRWELSNHAHAAWGRQAPSFTKLRLFGGFINGSFEPWVAPHKENRAAQIWAHGWS
jgi:hypothetical protein